MCVENFDINTRILLKIIRPELRELIFVFHKCPELSKHWQILKSVQCVK